jgi:hypothetical protein
MKTETKLEACNVCGNACYHLGHQLIVSLEYSKNKQYKIVGIPVAVLSNAQDCGRLIAGIAGSKTSEPIDFRLLYLLCVV